VINITKIKSTISIALTNQKIITHNLSKDDITSFGGCNGKITVTAAGSEKFEYSNDNGTHWQESNIFDNLMAITYQVKVRDKANIINVSAATSVTITQPDAKRVEVYVGVADNFIGQIKKPTEWSYVSQNADGFYINFIELDSLYKQSDLNAFGKLFANKNAFIESDMNSSIEKEQGYINRLQEAGFTIPYTSLNYGWDKTRQDNLKTYVLKDVQEPRLCFVQNGTWNIGGSIIEEKGFNGVFSNDSYRSWVVQSDGTSTDGPLGFWLTDEGQMKSASYSMVKYAHSLGKKAVQMLCPYGAGVKSYTPNMYLSIGIDCVREHEDNDADPDIWDVFEYATTIAAVPEQKDGAPYNSTTGMAYYLIKHIKGDPNTLDLYATDDAGAITGQGTFDPRVECTSQNVTFDQSALESTVYHYALNIANLSSWCDYTSVIKATTTGSTNAWTLQFKLGDVDITNNVLSSGFQFYQNNRLNPLTTQTVFLYITRNASSGDTNVTLNLELKPHNGSDTMDSLKIMSK